MYDLLNIYLTNFNDCKFSVQLYNSSGQMFYSDMVNETSKTTINTAPFPAGIYFVRNAEMVIKIIKY